VNDDATFKRIAKHSKTNRILKEAAAPLPPVYRVYHGTATRFRTFNVKKSTQGIIWFTSKKDRILKGEVGAQGKGFIVTADVTITKPAGWKEYDRLLLVQFAREGYDGAILPDSEGFDCFVFSPKQIKIISVDPV
jgi:hypothetical protein